MADEITTMAAVPEAVSVDAMADEVFAIFRAAIARLDVEIAKHSLAANARAAGKAVKGMKIAEFIVRTGAEGFNAAELDRLGDISRAMNSADAAVQTVLSPLRAQRRELQKLLDEGTGDAWRAKMAAERSKKAAPETTLGAAARGSNGKDRKGERTVTLAQAREALAPKAPATA